MTRLNYQTLESVPETIARGHYERSSYPKVVHLGVGAFHRAHQADYFDRLNCQIDKPWLITGASLRSPRAAEQLNPQDGLFLHIARGANTATTRINRAVTSVINAFGAPKLLTEAIAQPEVQLVTLTITEKGYCLDSSQTQLNMSDPDVRADCKHLDQPRTAIGHLVAGLSMRYKAGGNPITVLSCDNLSHNGSCTQRAVLAMAQIHDEGLFNWIQTHVSFPNAMVDRIAPALTKKDYQEAQNLLGVADQGLAVTEQFSQWVIEDNFAGERPPLEKVGVTWVSEVGAWEKRKLRLLNAAHSALAYVAGGANEIFVHTAINQPCYRDLLEALWSEVTTTIEESAEFDRAGYCKALIDRFSNPHLNHRLLQIAMDGSQKLPPRILSPLRERLSMDLASPTLTQIVAAWCQWVYWYAQKSSELLKDPMAGIFIEAIEAHDERTNFVDTLATVYSPLGDLMFSYPNWANELRRTVNTPDTKRK